MKKAKKLIALLLVAILLFSLSSCSKYDSQSFVPNSTKEEMDAIFNADDVQSANMDTRYTTAGGGEVRIDKIDQKKLLTAPLGLLSFLSYIAIFTGGIIVTPSMQLAASGEKFLLMVVKYTNNTNSTKFFGDIDAVAAVKAGEDYYLMPSAIVKSSKFSFGDDMTKINPGKTATIYLYAVLPEDVIAGASPLSVLFAIDGSAFLYDYRV